MLIQVSAGQGPVECSIVVEKFSSTILQEVKGSKIYLPERIIPEMDINPV